MDRYLEAATFTLAHADPRLILVHAVLGQAWGAAPDAAPRAGRGSAPQPPTAFSYVLCHRSRLAAPTRGVAVSL